MVLMTVEEIIDKVKNLHLPPESYVVFGSCPLAAAGIRPANDIDMLVSEAVFKSLAKQGWQILEKGPNDKPLVYNDFEAHSHWNFSSYKPTLAQLLKTANYTRGVPFASLEEVRKWKKASGRPKDLHDIALIDAYQARQTRL